MSVDPNANISWHFSLRNDTGQVGKLVSQATVHTPTTGSQNGLKTALKSRGVTIYRCIDNIDTKLKYCITIQHQLKQTIQ